MPSKYDPNVVRRSHHTTGDKKIDMEKLKTNRDYFMDKFDRGLIGVSYVFSPDQIGWLRKTHGPNWNARFIKNNIVGLIDSRFHVQSSLRGFV